MKKLIAVFAVTAISTAALAEAPTPVVPVFEDYSHAAGVKTVFKGDYLYMVGGGVATFDCNADGRPDLFAPGGEGYSELFVNMSKQGRKLHFQRVEDELALDKVLGAYPLDIDADGNMDLVILRQGENKVMRGLGDCKFEEANKAWNFDGGDAWSTSFSATFEKGAQWPTLAIGNYINPKEEISPWGSCTDNWLHRAEGKSFGKPIPLTPSYCALSMLFTDWNRSGEPSLRVSNDREYYEGGEEQMWKLSPGEPPKLYTAEEGWKRLRIWGMGIASADVNGDTYPDYFLTSMADQKLQFLGDPKTGKPDYKDLAFAKTVTLHRPTWGDDLKSSTGWHAQFEDANNDGLWDLFVAKGNVDKMPDFAAKDPNNLALGKADGTYVDVAKQAGMASTKTSRGGMMVDFDLDGKLDLVVVNRREPVQIWQNMSKNLGGWLQVQLQQDGPNRNGIGAWIEVRVGDKITRREITSGGGHASGHLGWWHFGLGAATGADMRVLWPDGTQGDWQPVSPNSFYVVKPGAVPVKWEP
jgi:hypothetical protein